jgi:hypothetical protein
MKENREEFYIIVAIARSHFGVARAARVCCFIRREDIYILTILSSSLSLVPAVFFPFRRRHRGQDIFIHEDCDWQGSIILLRGTSAFG